RTSRSVPNLRKKPTDASSGASGPHRPQSPTRPPQLDTAPLDDHRQQVIEEEQNNNGKSLLILVDEVVPEGDIGDLWSNSVILIDPTSDDQEGPHKQTMETPLGAYFRVSANQRNEEKYSLALHHISSSLRAKFPNLTEQMKQIPEGSAVSKALKILIEQEG